jgi:Rod binding domain-containing protein
MASLNRHENLVKQSQALISQTFFGTLLKQMRESPFKSDLFSGGRGGEAFGGLYDQQLAQRMSRGVGSKLVNAMVRKIEAKSAYRKSRMPGDK